ncbi:MAG TPA: SPOR domain-containing protein, partial [Steroidobacteraceae bacterium]|nr:SPOR domain-containing protein [Steroidobacteraceae bacterium]
RIRIEGFSLGSAPRLAQGSVAPQPGRTGVNALQLATGVAAGGPAGAAPATPADAGRTVVASADPDDVARPAPDAQETRPLPTAAVGLPAGASDSGYGVQLGAFGSEASAGREWERLKDRFGPELGGLAPRIIVASTGAGQLYRLQAPAGGEAQARALCAQLREQSQACVPVVPR